jgi:hypothetical protein
MARLTYIAARVGQPIRRRSPQCMKQRLRPWLNGRLLNNGKASCALDRFGASRRVHSSGRAWASAARRNG